MDKLTKFVVGSLMFVGGAILIIVAIFALFQTSEFIPTSVRDLKWTALFFLSGITGFVLVSLGLRWIRKCGT